MNIKLEYSITTNDFFEMIEAVGRKTYTKEQVEKSLNNTMYIVMLMENLLG